MKHTTYEHLISVSQTKGAGYCVLIDPDKIAAEKLPAFVELATDAGVDAFLVGGSLIVDDTFEQCIRSIKLHTDVPVVIFPGGVMQISKEADAILFLSLLSGRNPEHLIGSQVLAAPIVKKIGLEAISTAYLLVESGKITSAEFMSNTRPLPRHKPEIAVAHALAAEILGFKFIYFEAGSGADHPVPNEMIAATAHRCSVPIIAGGGLRTPEEARQKVDAGAKFIVTGTVLEKNGSAALIKELANAIHIKNS